MPYHVLVCLEALLTDCIKKAKETHHKAINIKDNVRLNE